MPPLKMVLEYKLPGFEDKIGRMVGGLDRNDSVYLLISTSISHNFKLIIPLI